MAVIKYAIQRWLLFSFLVLQSHSFVRHFHSMIYHRIASVPVWSGEDGLILNTMIPPEFRSGFVSIIGCPNAGKSTLMNRLVGSNISIVSSKPQTTRHRIMGVMSSDQFQCVFYDTPGLLEAKYTLHAKMMESVGHSLKNIDVVVAIVDITQVGLTE